jgi:hypothetical protein
MRAFRAIHCDFHSPRWQELRLFSSGNRVMSIKNTMAHSYAASLLLLATSIAQAKPVDPVDCSSPTAPACFVSNVFDGGSALNSAIGGGATGFNTDPVTINAISDDSTAVTEQTKNADGSLVTKVTQTGEDGSTGVTVVVTQPPQTNDDGSTSVSQHTTNPGGSTEDTSVTDTTNADGSRTRVTNTSFSDGTAQKISVTTGADGKFQLGEIDIDVPNGDGTRTQTHVSKYAGGTVLQSSVTTNADGSTAANYSDTFVTYSRDSDDSTTLKTETKMNNGDDLSNTITTLSDGTTVVLNSYAGMNKGTPYLSNVDQETYADGSFFAQIERDANDPGNESGALISEYSAYGVQLPACTNSDCWNQWDYHSWGGVPPAWVDGLKPSSGDIPAYISFDYQRDSSGAIVKVMSVEVDYVPDDPIHYDRTTLIAMAAAWKSGGWTYQVIPAEDQYIIVGRHH